MTLGLVRRWLCFVSIGSLHALAHAQGLYSMPGPWVDEANRPYALEVLGGTFTIATMAYGSCRKVCSTSTRLVKELHELAVKRRLNVNFVVFGLDPQQDRPSDWAALRSEQGMEFENLHFLTGSEAATQRAARSLGIRYWRYGDHVMHDFRIVLLSPEGRVVSSVEHFDDNLAVLMPSTAAGSGRQGPPPAPASRAHSAQLP
jgi:cytochrome oxidase Cu insertion factor (SCO1/SenC/PrrC family)